VAVDHGQVQRGEQQARGFPVCVRDQLGCFRRVPRELVVADGLEYRPTQVGKERRCALRGVGVPRGGEPGEGDESLVCRLAAETGLRRLQDRARLLGVARAASWT
jgi:hypothetical protein